jgi:molybdopterin-containing oxidoreductase family iron-sulfur binding subunit
MSKRKPYELAAPAPDAKVYWSSLDELGLSAEQVAELQKEREREFPEGASELNDPFSRRTFLSIMSAGIALATMQGCRRPLEKIVPYTRMPENVIPGVPSHYATVANIRGEAVGLVVESHEGRPTKIEGNPDHPGSLGAVDLVGQASVLDLYDPDRSRQPAQKSGNASNNDATWTHTNKTWNEFDGAFLALVESHVANGGAGLRILAEPTISPTFVRLRDEVMRRFPQARFHTWESASNANVREGARLAYGVPVTTVYAFDRAKVIVSLDSDFLQTEPGAVRNMRGFSDGRRLHGTTDEMNRLYQIESPMTTTGANADHRLRLPSRDIAQYAKALAARLATEHHLALGDVGAAVNGANPPEGVPASWIDAVARDLFEARGQSIVVAGRKQPPMVHALAHALNEALGNVGRTIVHGHVADPAEADHAQDLRALCDSMAQHQVTTLVILGGNPVYDAPGDLDFAGKLANVTNVVHVSMFRDETSTRSTWHAPRAHFLETWGDARAIDGTVSVQQPLIAPMYSGRSDIEILGMIANVPARRGYDLVQATLRGPEVAGHDERAFMRVWRRALNRGVVAQAMPAPMTGLAVRNAEIAAQVRAHQPGNALSRQNLELVFQVDAKMHDGRHANNAWLMELPDPITKIVWDNAACLSPRTAADLGVRSGDMITLHKGDRSVRAAAWILPGQADNSIMLALGWGRRNVGRIADGRGFDANPLRDSNGGIHFVDGVTVQTTGERYRLVQTQEHHRMEGRPLALEATLDEYRAMPRFAMHRSPTPRTLPLWREVNYNGHKWGMVIDLNACTGCNACAVACQSENNVPVVGKDQVYRGREMHWLRVDRYFVGNENDPEVAVQPVMCVQCEEAPCENVCPVNATSHSPEGLNDMTYNRCIGTRYCSNNCPYKVRRFNYLNWHNDGPYQPRDPDVPETVCMQHNPNVTVRFRGVMEKCTYCVQRIQSTKIAAKRDNRPIRDGEIVTACQQTCPANAITFGDLNDERSRVAAAARNERGYKLLAELGTQPRTTYLAKVRNPNPEMHG